MSAKAVKTSTLRLGSPELVRGRGDRPWRQSVFFSSRSLASVSGRHVAGGVVAGCGAGPCPFSRSFSQSARRRCASWYGIPCRPPRPPSASSSSSSVAWVQVAEVRAAGGASPWIARAPSGRALNLLLQSFDLIDGALHRDLKDLTELSSRLRKFDLHHADEEFFAVGLGERIPVAVGIEA